MTVEPRFGHFSGNSDAGVKSEIPDWMIIDAVRYAIGRQSYQVGITCEWLRRNWSNLSEHVKTIVRNDVEEAFRFDDRDRENGYPYKHLGMDMDRREWETVRALWESN